jgi:hypothetical protein
MRTKRNKRYYLKQEKKNKVVSTICKKTNSSFFKALNFILSLIINLMLGYKLLDKQTITYKKRKQPSTTKTTNIC